MLFVTADWTAALSPETPVLELVLRASFLYLALLFLMRFVRRAGGEVATMDLVFVLLVAEAAAHAFGDYTSIADGLVVILTLIVLNYVINALSYHLPVVERLVSASPIEIVRDGKMLRRNMRREFLTEEELLSHLRMEGLERVDEVKSARVEGDGRITVIKRR